VTRKTSEDEHKKICPALDTQPVWHGLRSKGKLKYIIKSLPNVRNLFIPWTNDFENFIAPHLVLPIYGYRTVKYDVQNHPSLNLVLKQVNPVHILTSYLSKTRLISFSITRRCTGLPDNRWNGKKNFQHLMLVESSKILLPPLHIKLGRKKNFVRAMDNTGPAFRYLAEKFPGISDAKIKEDIFIGPQIR